MSEITVKLLAEQDLKFKDFNQKIVPDTRYEMIGVKLPEIRRIVNSVTTEEASGFFNEKHVYYEEVMTYGLLLTKLKDTDEIYSQLNKFLPIVDNWAVCDTVATSLKKLANNKELLWQKILNWLQSDKIYTKRFAIVCLLAYFSGKEYSDKVYKTVSAIDSDEYYVNMAISWLYSVILVKDYDFMVKILETKRLPRFIQNKTIDKARDSFRIDKTKKDFLKTLKK